MVTVKLNGQTLAESSQTRVVEGNHYFPPSDVKREFFTDSQTHTTCGWKGVASYYNADVNGEKVSDVAWYYPQAKDKAKDIEGYVAFYKNKVEISG